MSTTTLPRDTTRHLFVAGHIAKGVVYIILGGMAVATLFGGGGSPTSGYQGVLQFIQDQPFGQFLLILMALGLFAYCFWRWVKSLYDLGGDGDDKKGMAKRIGYAASGTAYGMLAITAFTIAIGNSNGGGGNKQDLISTILSEPWGQIVIGVLALIFLGVGIFQLRRGLEEKYMDELQTSRMDQRERNVYEKLGKAGHIARAVVFAIIAYFLFRAAISNDPSQFRDIGGALEFLGSGFSLFLMALVGLGLLLYGIFMLAKARYAEVRKFPTSLQVG